MLEKIKSFRQFFVNSSYGFMCPAVHRCFESSYDRTDIINELWKDVDPKYFCESAKSYVTNEYDGKPYFGSWYVTGRDHRIAHIDRTIARLVSELPPSVTLKSRIKNYIFTKFGIVI